jgi:hypothetical protein
MDNLKNMIREVIKESIKNNTWLDVWEIESIDNIYIEYSTNTNNPNNIPLDEIIQKKQSEFMEV